jgi:hypothetical protein
VPSRQRKGIVRTALEYLGALAIFAVVAASAGIDALLDELWPSEPETAASAQSQTYALDYRVDCKLCGFSTTIDQLKMEPGKGNVKVHVVLRNSGEKGRLSFVGTRVNLYALDEARARRVTESQERSAPFLGGLGATVLSSSVVQAAGERGVSLLFVNPGATWEGWLTLEGSLPRDAVALVFTLLPFQGTGGIYAWYSWYSDQPREPVIRLGLARPE